MSTIIVKDANGVDRYFSALGEGDLAVPFLSVPADFNFEVSKGNVVNHSKVNKFGRNTDIDTATTPEDVWDVGGVWIPPTAARIHDIASTSTNDTSAGTGVRTILIEGLDSNWDMQTETITMNGTTNVPTVNSYVRIFRMYGVTFGSNERNVGNITATAQTDATVTAQITADKGQTLMAIYSVPNGKTAYVKQGFADINRTGVTGGAMATLAFEFRLNADQADSGWRVAWEGALSVEGSSFLNLPYTLLPAFTEKSDLRLRVLSVTDNDTDISGGFDIILVDN